MDESLLKSEEKAVFALRSLYRRYGYLPFRMSKFEEYELYIRNKDFLVSDRIITFNDTNGRLLALKPDVTLSIIRSGEDRPGFKQKVYYNENVYRVSESTCQYKEIMQAGLECIGDIDLYDIYEVITLAAESLSMISEDFVLEISHLGLLSAVLDKMCPDKAFGDKAIHFISEKNVHDLQELCRQHGIGERETEALSVFVTAYGERGKVVDVLESVWGDGLQGGFRIRLREGKSRLSGKEQQALGEGSRLSYEEQQTRGEGSRPSYEEQQTLGGGSRLPQKGLQPPEELSRCLAELKELSHLLEGSAFSERIRFDFSVVNDMNYYNGFVFKGFLAGICGGVLAGGQYDKMMARMDRSSGAVGFAIYLDLLEQLRQERAEYDVDVLLVYDSGTASHTVAGKVRELIASGRSVTAQKTIPEKLRYREILDLREGKDLMRERPDEGKT